MLRDYDNVDDVNKKLEQLGYNMGMRVIEDFLSRTNSPRCLDMNSTAEKIQLAFR
jgi:trafficking protein particle complex subunit 3